MARIQVLRLPAERVGELEATPFALVIDGIYEDISSKVTSLQQFAEMIGARGTLVSEFPLDVA